MIREIRSVIWKANFDDSIRVVMLTGEGRAFCAGRDIKGLDYENNLETAGYRAYVRANHEMFDDFENLEKPIIAVVNGICAGGGVEMAVASDFRIASSTASFLLPENQLGVIPASGACFAHDPDDRHRPPEGNGDGCAAGAGRGGAAHRSGDARLSAGKADGGRAANSRGICSKLAPAAMGMGKQIINMCQNVDTETGRLLERLGQSILIKTEDNKEGMNAFIEKRPPVSPENRTVRDAEPFGCFAITRRLR